MPLLLEYLWYDAPVVLEARHFVVFFPDIADFVFQSLGKQHFYTTCDTDVQTWAAFPFFFLSVWL